jgi:hypothetical protein
MTAPPTLQYASLAGDVPPPTLENVYLLQQAADYRMGHRTLRSSGIGDLIWGVICMGLGFVALRVAPINIGLMLLGVFVFAVGIWCLVLPMPITMIFDGIALILTGVWNIGISIYNAMNAPAGSSPRPMFLVLAIFQLAWGGQRLARYRRFANASSLVPGEQTVRWLDETIKSIGKAKPETDPTIIQFTTQGFSSMQMWKARLLPDLAIVIQANGQDAMFLPRDQITIAPKKKVLLGKTMKAQFALGGKKVEGTIAPQWLERFNAWRGAGAATQVVPPLAAFAPARSR